jgi:hypothetical protein
MVSHYDLKRQAEFYAGPEVGQAIMCEFMSSHTLGEMLDDFDALKRGRISERVLIAGGDESITDPSRVPPGCGLFHGITFAPFAFEDGGSARWDEIAEEMGDRSLAAYRKFVKNLTAENIIKRSIVTPLDHARHMPNSMVGGDVHGIAPYFYQTGGHRPTPDLAQYTVPGISRFYLVGPFQHPGGGVYGAGRATAMRMFEHLGLDFTKVAETAAIKNGATTSLPTAAVGATAGPDALAGPGAAGSAGAAGSSAASASPAALCATLYGPADEDLLTIRTIERSGEDLVVKGRAYGTMPIEVTLRPDQARRLVKMMRFSFLPFLFALLFRRSKRS